MLYSYSDLQNIVSKDTRPLSRYLYKFELHRKEVKNLKTHEKDFLFRNMYLLLNEKNERCFDLSTIDEASDYCFSQLILIYRENLNFDKLTINPFGQIIESQAMKNDKACFDKYYAQWTKQLETRKGKYFSIIHIELNRKLKELRFIYNEGKISETDYNYQIKYLYTIAFYIYYKVRLFFDGAIEKFVLLNALEKKIVINIYSFVHTLFRHYIPSLDIGSQSRSINEPVPFLDIENFPFSIRDFLTAYFEYDNSPLTCYREYLLFSFNNDRYIIWLKYYKLEELSNNYGFEFRTLYKCEAERDLNKFYGLAEHRVNKNLSFYF